MAAEMCQHLYKMQPLATARKVLTWLSICPADKSASRREKFGYFAHSLIVFILSLIGITTSAAYCIKFFAIDFNGALFLFMAVIAEFGMIYFMIVAVRMRYQIEGIFTDLWTIYKNNENQVVFQYLVQANNISEQIWMLYIKYVPFIFAVVAATSALSVLFCYVTQESLNVDQFYLPAKFFFPWNQTTYVGYFCDICAINAIGYAYLILNWISMLLFISLCLHHQAFYKMFQHSTDQAEKCDAKQLTDLICFHISVKNWFIQSANVYNSFVLIQLIYNTVTMATSVFYLDLQWQHMDYIMVSVSITSLVSMATLLLHCYFGKLANTSFEMMPECLFKMNWYEQPNELQKYFILMIANMQKPVYYHGFNVVKLDLETFVTLLRKVFSFYIAIKAVASK